MSLRAVKTLGFASWFQVKFCIFSLLMASMAKNLSALTKGP